MGVERKYRKFKLSLGKKAAAAKEERQVRDREYETLSTKEKLVCDLLIDYAHAIMRGIAREETVNEARYATLIVKVVEEG